MHALSLDKITVRELTPIETIDLAAELGYQAIGLWAYTADTRMPVSPPLSDKHAKREIVERLAGTGVRVHCIECFILRADTDMATCAPALEYGAELGARQATAVIFDNDPIRSRENFAQLAEMAAKHALTVNLEFLPFSPINSLAKAVQLVQATNKANVGILVDILHLIRTGGSISDLKAVPDELIGYAQICDGLARIDPHQIFFEAVFQRMVPGQGEFPLREFMAALPKDVIIGIEVPLKDMADRGIDARVRARVIDRRLRKTLTG